jgi:hypothetical protein
MSVSFTRRHFILGLLAGLIVGGAVIIPRLNSQPECQIIPATRQDFAQAIAIGANVFEPEIWRLETGEHPSLISVGWFDDEHEAIAHSQYLLYNCGYTQTDIDTFYGDENMKIMLGGYNSWQQTAICQHDDITLREFTMDYDGTPFAMRFWIQPVNDKRVRDINLAFAVKDADLMDQYAARLFPDFTSCAGKT